MCTEVERPYASRLIQLQPYNCNHWTLMATVLIRMYIDNQARRARSVDAEVVSAPSSMFVPAASSIAKRSVRWR